jgi:ATP adenylyltransferase
MHTQGSVIFTPHRKKYIIDKPVVTGCLFCTLAEESPSIANHILLQTERAIVMLNRYPYATGHIMVVPRKHIAEYERLSQKDHAEINRLITLSLHALKKTYAPHGFNVGLNIGKASGAGIPDHLHFHVVARWDGDANFMTAIGQSRIIPDSLDGVYRDLKPHFHRRACDVT